MVVFGRGVLVGSPMRLTPRASPLPARSKQDLRIDFAFDYAFFDLRALPVRIPYPVPFKLLGDETKGWIDITYLSPDGTFRLSRGNKGAPMRVSCSAASRSAAPRKILGSNTAAAGTPLHLPRL